MKRFTIIALGSRGDVQPFIALGLGLQAAGYSVTIAAAADYAELVASYGLAFHGLVGQISALVDPAMVEQFLARARNPLPPTMLAVDSVPHDWLFAQVRAVVHHGGAGVTAQALRAGVPAIVVPFLGDQYFWAERIAELGAGPAPIPRAQLSGDRLAQAITAALHSSAMRERAATIGRSLQAEPGVARAVALIDSCLHDLRSRR